jgi:hypothetical protein
VCRCLAHVINIATQKLISAYSKSPHFNAHTPTAHIPDTSTAVTRDEIGLVRAIAVKVGPLLVRIRKTHFVPGAFIFKTEGSIQTNPIASPDGSE